MKRSDEDLEHLNRTYTVARMQSISNEKEALGRVVENQGEDIMESLREILSPTDFSKICHFKDPCALHVVYFEALLEKVHKDADEVVDPILIPNLIKIRSDHDPSEKLSLHEADQHELEIRLPEVAMQTEDSVLEFSDRIRTAQEAVALLDDWLDLANHV